MNHMQPGDIVVRDKGPCRHLGIVINGDLVLHNTPELGEHVSSMHAFCQGKPYRVFHIPNAFRWVVLANASRIAAYPRRYDSIEQLRAHCYTGVGTTTAQFAVSPRLNVGCRSCAALSCFEN